MDETDQRFHDFVQARGSRMVSFAYVLTRNLATAEDLVQESLLKSYRQWRKAGAPEHPDAYVRRAIVNEYVSAGRRTQVAATALTLTEQQHPRLDPDVAERDHMWQLLATLPRNQQAVLALRYYDDLTDEDIAAALGCARGTVRSLASRALAALRDHPDLAHRYDEEEAGSTS